MTSARVARIYTVRKQAPPEIRMFGPYRIVKSRELEAAERAPEQVPIGCTGRIDKKFAVVHL